MFATDQVNFKDGLPSLWAVILKARSLSQLDDITLGKENGEYFLWSPTVHGSRTPIVYDGQKILLLRYWIGRDYIHEITLASLILLGGQYEGEMEEWTDQPWQTFKNDQLAFETLRFVSLIVPGKSIRSRITFAYNRSKLEPYVGGSSIICECTKEEFNKIRDRSLMIFLNENKNIGTDGPSLIVVDYEINVQFGLADIGVQELLALIEDIIHDPISRKSLGQFRSSICVG